MAYSRPVQTPALRPKRRLKGQLAIMIMDFIEAYGPSNVSFLAEFYHRRPREVSNVCAGLRRGGYLVRWYFDGFAMYGLPGEAPGIPESDQRPDNSRYCPKTPHRPWPTNLKELRRWG